MERTGNKTVNKVTAQELLDIRRNHEQAKSDHDKAQGSHEQIMKSLKSDFGLDNMGSASTAYSKLIAEVVELEAKLESEVEELNAELDKLETGAAR